MGVVSHPKSVCNNSSKCAGDNEPKEDENEWKNVQTDSEDVQDMAYNVPNNNQGVLPLNTFNRIEEEEEEEEENEEEEEVVEEEEEVIEQVIEQDKEENDVV